MIRLYVTAYKHTIS